MNQPTVASEAPTLTEFLSIVQRLRRECPWDREQTHRSLRPMLIEEAYETVEAIDHAVDTGDYTELKKELGDLLLHILFHSDLAREEGHFTLDDVIEAECEKLIYRHPHVFSDVKVEDAEHVSRNWEQLKRREKGRNSVLDGVPASLPALQRAQRIQERAEKVGFDWPNSEGVWKKIREEVLELEEELNSPSSERGVGKDRPRSAGVVSSKEDEFGDLLFSLVNLARHEGFDAEGALREATQKFDRRFRGIEAEVEASGKPMQDFSLEELDAIWDRIKHLT
ncbi:MAG TPA: nucleoside triphosphate pyrophosphohydrolase [Candidatus Kapabacteria bacterium]|nr:nucleoside triphosphate pyrophosphohydrolase [Candidatus Kapabacteria bacterium]